MAMPRIGSHPSTQEAFTVTIDGSIANDPAPGVMLLSSHVPSGGFKTWQALADSLPEYVNHTITVNVAAGTYGSVEFYGLRGKGRINIIGGYTASSPATGPATGTAAAGTTTTALKNPGTNWTSNNLRNNFLVLSSGGGAPSVKPILSNTTTDAVTHATTGQAQGSVFTIGTPNVTGVTATITDCRCLIYFYGVQFTRSTSSDSRVYYDGCYFSTSNVDGSIRSEYDRTMQIYNCLFDDTATVYSLGSNIVEILYCALEDGAVTVIDADRFTCEIDAVNCTQEPVYIKDARAAYVGLSASNNALGASGSILHLDGVAKCSPYGTGITGSSNTSAYGVEQENGGLFIATGVTLTGASGDLYQDGQAVTWATLAIYGTYSWGRSSVVLASSVWDVLNTNIKVNGACTIASDTSIGGRNLVYGYQHNASSHGITAYAGGGQANATVVGPFFTSIGICATAGDSVKLRSNPALGDPGMWLWLVNDTANSCNVYPNSQYLTQSIDALGANNPYALAAGKICIFYSTSVNTWRSIPLN